MLRPSDTLGPYVLIRELGRGAFGVVWLAELRTPYTTTQVALKIPFAGTCETDAFIREAQLWVTASGHPNVIPVHKANLHDGHLVLELEYAADGCLHSWLAQFSRRIPPITTTVEIVRGILSGLRHLHSRSIAHRDLKPANVLIQAGIPRLTDFGVARVLQTTRHSQGVGGTPPYMSPEAWNGNYSHLSDIWSVGVIMYELLTGTLPFPQSEMLPLFVAIANAPHPALPTSIPPWIRETVDRALAKHAADRYTSAAAMLDAMSNRSHESRKHPEQSPAKASSRLSPFELRVVDQISDFLGIDQATAIPVETIAKRASVLTQAELRVIHGIQQFLGL